MAEQHALAESVLKSPEGRRYPVELHHGFTHLDKGSWDELYAHSFLLRLGGVDVGVLSAEDHLCILCLHLLCHGVWRLLWLCDIAAALELRSPAFNWDRCLEACGRRYGERSNRNLAGREPSCCTNPPHDRTSASNDALESVHHV